MLDTFKDKLKIKKWEHIPVFGTLAYSVRVEFFLNWNYQGTKVRRIIKRPRFIFTNIITLISLAFSITGFVMKFAYHEGPFPWPFIVAICIGTASLLSTTLIKKQFEFGIKKFKKLPKEEQTELLSNAEIKREEIEEARLNLFNKKDKK